MNMEHIFGVFLVLLMSYVFLDLASASITKNPVDTEVMVGHSTYLNCSTSDPSREIHWYHYPVGGGTKDHEYVYAHGRMHSPFDKRFRIEKDYSPGSFDLVMTNVEFRDAGLYVCQNGGGTGQLISAQLVVLDSPLSCETNIKSDGFIGPNSCDLQTDKVQLSCGVDYHGNIHPALDWTKAGQNNFVSGSKLLCNNSDTHIKCSMTLDAEVNMDGSAFVCQTTRAAQEQYRCTTDKATVLYALSDKKPVEKTIGDDVSCSTKTNSPSCSYKWIWFDGVTEKTVSNDQNLKVEQQGWHRCEANCKIKENPCTVVPKLVKASSAPVPAGVNDSKLDVIIAVFLTFILCALIAAIPGYFIWKTMTGETKELRASVEALREKESAWKEENLRIQGQLRQVEELTATMLETHAKEHVQPNGSEIERNRNQLKFVVRNAGVSYREEDLLMSNEFSGNPVPAPNGAKKEIMKYPSMKNHGTDSSPIITQPIGEKKLKKELPSKGNSQDENMSLLSNNCNEDSGEHGTNEGFLRIQVTENTVNISWSLNNMLSVELVSRRVR